MQIWGKISQRRCWWAILSGRFSSQTLKDAGSSLSALERHHLFGAKVDYKKSNLTQPN